MSNDVSESKPARTAIVLFFFIAILIASDLVGDYLEGGGVFHLTVELLVFLVATGGMAFLLLLLRQTKRGLGEALAEARRWRNENRELMRGLGTAIQKQFNGWGLSKAEAEVGLLLLKGLTHKEIAAIRKTTERTAREQARALYRKSTLPGRSALSSFFLEDLLPPKGDI